MTSISDAWKTSTAPDFYKSPVAQSHMTLAPPATATHAPTTYMPRLQSRSGLASQTSQTSQQKRDQSLVHAVQQISADSEAFLTSKLAEVTTCIKGVADLHEPNCDTHAKINMWGAILAGLAGCLLLVLILGLVFQKRQIQAVSAALIGKLNILINRSITAVQITKLL